MCQRESTGAWGAPVNLGPEVNTEGDELFPFIHADHALFFSSDGHAGLGGLDVLMTWAYKGSCQPAVNLGAPVNGRSDDIGFVLDHTGGNAWWASDRSGGSGGEDVYHLRLNEPFRNKVRIHGRVLGEEGGEALERIPVRALKLDRTILAQATTNAAGEYEFVITPQPMVVWGGIPGASESELPLDEHLLGVAEGDLSMGDIRLSTLLDVPLAVRVLEATTGLPARGVQITIKDERGGRWDLKGSTDAQGLVRFTLPNAKLGETLGLRLTIAYEEVERSEELSLKVVDGTLRRIERRMELGQHAVAAVVPSTIGRYHALDQLDEGSQWAGRVVDAGNGEPLEHVQVSLLDVSGAEIVRTETDNTGHYHLRTGSVPFSVQAAIPGGDSARVDGISPFGDMDLADMALDGVMDLPVNAMLSDAVTAEPLEGVEVVVVDKRDGALLLSGRTDVRGVLQGTIKDRRFGSEQNIEVRFSKEGYITQQVNVDFSVLAFLEQSLGGLEGFRMMPSLAGLDLADAMHLRPILFDYNDARIRSDAAQELELVARVMQVDTTIVLELRSHTDCRGGAAFNRFLSVRRAQSAFDHLVGLGIAPSRLRAKGMGELQPVNHCADGVVCTEAQHQENRRTEFIVVKAGGMGAREERVVQGGRP
jgi:outer membrane protein OmpA-like peptidoglycan-associated protein/5-hydroxyisourate hydrolase-like protein (transthyretin family)